MSGSQTLPPNSGENRNGTLLRTRPGGQAIPLYFRISEIIGLPANAGGGGPSALAEGDLLCRRPLEFREPWSYTPGQTQEPAPRHELLPPDVA